MKTPVFNQAKMIVGFLEHEDRWKPPHGFSVRSVPPMPLPDLKEDMTSRGPTATAVAMEWAIIGSGRENRRVSYCDVLIASDEAALQHVAGFTYFAEEFGRRVDISLGYSFKTATA
jgi:hypothetical protein